MLLAFALADQTFDALNGGWQRVDSALRAVSLPCFNASA
jgi:hypothetical protein